MSNVDTKKLREQYETNTPSVMNTGSRELLDRIPALLDEIERLRDTLIVSQDNESRARNERDDARRQLDTPRAGLCGEIDAWRERWEEEQVQRDAAGHRLAAAQGQLAAAQAEIERLRDDGAGFKGVGYEISRSNLGTLIEQRDAARANARVLAHAYTHDSRPPARAVEEALAYPAIPGRDGAK